MSHHPDRTDWMLLGLFGLCLFAAAEEEEAQREEEERQEREKVEEERRDMEEKERQRKEEEEKQYCTECGDPISEEDYENYDGKCYDCWNLS